MLGVAEQNEFSITYKFELLGRIFMWKFHFDERADVT